MFAVRYFAATYFAPTYFAERGHSLSQPAYFFHGYFPARYFADRYFPGSFSHVIPPVPPIVIAGGGGAVHPPFILTITGIADLVLPAFRCDALGVVLPPSITGTADLFFPIDTILASIGKSTPARIKAVGQFSAPQPFAQAAGVMRIPRQKAVTVDDLRRQVEGLQRRVQELEDERYAIRRDDDRD